MSDNDDALLSIDDATEIGFKIVEMADRVRRMHSMMRGTQALWHFDIDGIRYSVKVGVAEESG